jgi:hypothetical protein
MRRDHAAARAEGQRRRIIALLEELADADPKDQCPKCGDWYDNLSAHEPHCDGP